MNQPPPCAFGLAARMKLVRDACYADITAASVAPSASGRRRAAVSRTQILAALWNLTLYADFETRVAYPAQETQADDVGCSLGHLGRALGALERAGIITRVPAPRGVSSNAYRVEFDELSRRRRAPKARTRRRKKAPETPASGPESARTESAPGAHPVRADGSGPRALSAPAARTECEKRAHSVRPIRPVNKPMNSSKAPPPDLDTPREGPGPEAADQTPAGAAASVPSVGPGDAGASADAPDAPGTPGDAGGPVAELLALGFSPRDAERACATAERAALPVALRAMLAAEVGRGQADQLLRDFGAEVCLRGARNAAYRHRDAKLGPLGSPGAWCRTWIRSQATDDPQQDCAAIKAERAELAKREKRAAADRRERERAAQRAERERAEREESARGAAAFRAVVARLTDDEIERGAAAVSLTGTPRPVAWWRGSPNPAMLAIWAERAGLADGGAA
jgi:hypothetical protein